MHKFVLCSVALFAADFIGQVAGQALTTGVTVPSTTTSSTSTVTIVLPSGAPSTVQASIVAADPSQTVYVLGCNGPSTATTTDAKCGFKTPITLTQGPSTLVFTATDPIQDEFTNPLIQPEAATTIACVIVGADLMRTPVVTASAALCTGNVPIPGLGYLGSTTALSGTQIQYVGVTVTAGVEKLVAAREAALRQTSTTTSTAAAATMTARAILFDPAWAGLVAVAALGAV